MALQPGDGERRAVRGLAAQYRVAAQLIYEALLDGTLEWVRLADPEAGRLDDIQIATAGRVDAYQVKWSEYEGRATLGSLLRESRDGAAVSPSPIAQLAHGWRRLSASNPDREVHAHFLARDSASAADNTGGPISGKWPAHFQAFLRHGYQHRDRWASGDAQVTDWSAPIEAIRKASGLELVEFAKFLPASHLDLGFQLESLDQLEATGGASRRRAADLRHIATWLFNAVADDGRPIEFSQSDLVAGLGWSRRLDLRFRHDFPVDERTYRPISSTTARLDNALQQISRGYLALVGPPGSGKSTTLTQMLKYRPGYRVLRYYAYVRGDTTQGRGEAEAFLADLCVAVRRSGVPLPRGSYRLPNTFAEHQTAFGEALAALGDDWRTNGVKTLIMIDGLDHIERELNPARPLYEVLPSPDAVPDGVIFVLGSQQVGLGGLSSRTRAHLAGLGRTIEMDRLDRGAVLDIAATVLPADVLTEDRLAAIWGLSGGHPLALTYLLERLANATTEQVIDETLGATDPFSGDITEDYRVYWSAIADDPELRDLLGMLCRLRNPVDLGLMAELKSDAVLERFVSRAAQYFRKETSNRWAFFHNSFRQFLIGVTATDAFGTFSQAIDCTYHHRLALAAQGSPETPFGWEALYHLSAAGENGTVLDLFTQHRMRAQFFARRPLGEIREDITVCLKAASTLDDRVAFVRALLIEHELTERQDALSDIDLPKLYVQLDVDKDLSDLLIKGDGLRISELSALEFAILMHERSDATLARRLFDLGEPTAWLNGSRPVKPGDRRLLRRWARAAWRFHSLDTTLELIRNVRTQEPGTDPEGDEEGDEEEALNQTIALKADLIEIVAAACLDASRNDYLARALAEITAMDTARGAEADARLNFRRADRAVLGRLPVAEGLEAWRACSAFWTADSLDPDSAMAIALTGLRLGAEKDMVTSYIDLAPNPLLADPDIGGADKGLGPFHALIQQATVRAAQGRPFDPVADVPDARDSWRQGNVLLRRMLVLIANVRGEADGGSRLAPDQVVHRLRPAMMLFDRPWTDVRDWTDWHSVRNRHADYFAYILRTAEAHGYDAFLAVLQALETSWDPATPRPYWTPEWRRGVAMAAYAIDQNRGRTVGWLSELGEGGDIVNELESRISHHAGQAEAWLEVGEVGEARAEIDRLLKTSFGVYHSDDNQMERWADWAAKALACGAVGPEAILPLLRASPVMYANRRGHDPDAVAGSLLAAIGSAQPSWAFTLGEWLRANGGVSRNTALAGWLRGALEAAPTSAAQSACVIAAARLLAPFEDNADSLLAEAIGRAFRRISPKGAAGPEVRSLVQQTATTIYPHNRDVWRVGLRRGVEATGGDPLIYGLGPLTSPPNAKTDDEPEGVTLADDAFVSLADIRQSHGTPTLFATLLGRAVKVCLDWPTILADVLEHAATAEVDRVRIAIGDRRTLQTETWFAGRFLEAGSQLAAKSVAESAISLSRPQGWMRYYDGGTRLDALAAVIAIDPEQGRRNAFELLVRDYLSEIRYPRDLLRSLSDLIAVLFPTEPTSAIWAEIAQHVDQLAEVQSAAATEPTEPASLPIEHILVSRAFLDLIHPVPEVTDGARKFLVDVLDEVSAKDAVGRTVRQWLSEDSDKLNETAVVLLSAAMESASDWVGEFTASLTSLVDATPSAIVRSYAEQLLDALDVVSGGRPSRPLPAIYRLELPPIVMGDVSAFDPLKPGQTLNDTDDPVELSRPFTEALELISVKTGISERVLMTRQAALMSVVEPKSNWDFKAEKAMRDSAESERMTMTYRRLRAAVGLRALGRLILELTDAGRMEWPPLPLRSWLVPVDPWLSLLDPSSRPNWLDLPVSEAMASRSEDANWTGRPADDLTLAPLHLSDGGMVLGEIYRARKSDHRHPEINRSTMVSLAGRLWRGDETPRNFFLPKFPRGVLARDYPPPQPIKWPRTMVGRGGSAITSEFLALHPGVASTLNWRPSDSGLFAWEDQTATLMASTIYWRDGNLLHHDALWRGEVCGEGWAVVATPQGVQALRSRLGDFSQYLVTSREVERIGDWAEPVVAMAERTLAADARPQSIKRFGVHSGRLI